MRKIKFRGMRVDSDEWVYGTGITDFLNIEKTHRSGNTCWLWSNYSWIPVHPETVGQFIGLTSKGSIEIYEDDFVQYQNDHVTAVFEIVFYEGEFLRKQISANDETGARYGLSDGEVIGNIHQNPELLK